MSRNNSRRQRTKTEEKTQQPPKQPNIPIQAAPNPFAATFVVPTEIVDLPTRGIFYSEDNPLSQIEKVEIKHMTAREEDILGNQDFISRGIVLDRLIEAILINKDLNVADLADIDKIAILATARKTGFGDEYKQTMTCHECEKESIFVFSMENLINNATDDTREEPEGLLAESTEGAFNVDLSVCGYTAAFRPLNSDDYEYLVDLEKQRNKHSLDFNYTVEFLRRMIVSIHKSGTPSEVTSDPGTISQFLDFIPAQDSRKLKLAHSYLTPTFRMHEEVECPECSTAGDKEVAFSWAMFWGNT